MSDIREAPCGQIRDHQNHRFPIKCFTSEPSLKSSLKFLRQIPWARKKVEDLYLEVLNKE